MGQFASRAGEKLQFALDKFGISIKDFVVGDFGSSTGGFVDCLLQAGAKVIGPIPHFWKRFFFKI
jgi:23S rRNA (cytidine1920-2'-O)/16S rRNA (cytidine1409-2'-O)-methyltransferase